MEKFFKLKPGLGITLLTSGLIFLVIIISMASEAYSFRSTAKETSAVVTEIEVLTLRTKFGGKNHKYMAYARYTVDGQVYESRLTGYYPNLSKGDQIAVIYNPENPSSVRSADYKSTSEHLLPIAIISVVLGAVLTAISFMNGGASIKTNSKLLSGGIPVKAKVLSISIDTTRKIKGIHPYRALCEANNPVTGERFLYNSHGVEKNIRHLVGKNVLIYCDKSDRENYYVDLDSAFEDTVAQEE